VSDADDLPVIETPSVQVRDDDEALADALAAELAMARSGVIPVIPPDAGQSVPPAFTSPQTTAPTAFDPSLYFGDADDEDDAPPTFELPSISPEERIPLANGEQLPPPLEPPVFDLSVAATPEAAAESAVPAGPPVVDLELDPQSEQLQSEPLATNDVEPASQPEPEPEPASASEREPADAAVDAPDADSEADPEVTVDDQFFSDVPQREDTAPEIPQFDVPVVGAESVVESAGVPEFDTPVAGGEPVADSPVQPPAVSMTPEEQAAALALYSAPVGRPWTPERRSLPDDKLVEVLDSASGGGGTLEKMQELEEQLRLREEEAREYAEWEESMLAVGTPEALEAVSKVRPAFVGLVGADPSIPAIAPPLPPQGQAPFDAPPPTAPPLAFDAPPPFDAAAPFIAPPPVEPNPLVGSPPLDEPGPRVEPIPLVDPEQFDASPPLDEASSLVDPPPLVEPPVAPDLPEPWDIPARALEHLDTGGIGVVSIGSDDVIDAEIVDESEAAQPVPLDPAADSTTAASSPIDFDDLLGAALVSTGVDSTSVESPLPHDNVASDAPVSGSVAAAESGIPEPVQADSSDDIVPPVKPTAAPIFSIEPSGTTPTPVDQRVGRAARMFWLWFAANSSIVSVGFGATLFGLGMSLRQAVIAAVIGVALSCFPLGLGASAGKRSGQPTVIVSRAAFGVIGNIVPAILALVTRVFWGAVLLWLAATSTAFIVIGAELGGPLTYDQLVIIGLAVGFILAILVAFFGYSLLAKFQLVVTIISAILIVGLIAMTWSYVDIRTAFTVPDGNWILVVTGTVLVFSFIGLVWANSSADLARYQRSGASGGGSMLWASFGTTLPTFVLIAYGAVLAASNPELAAGLVERPLDVLAGLLPLWYPAPLIIATALSLLSGIVISVYSAGFALQGVGVRLSRQWTTLIVGLLLFFVAWVLSILDIDLSALFTDVATTLAVPVAAWVGIFAADTMIRKRRYHAPSLLSTGGIYPAIHWVNLSMFVVISGIGFAFTTATVSWLTWQGYGFGLMGVPLSGEIAASDFGVLLALVLGVLTPIVAGIPGIRKQESAVFAAN